MTSSCCRVIVFTPLNFDFISLLGKAEGTLVLEHKAYCFHSAKLGNVTIEVHSS